MYKVFVNEKPIIITSSLQVKNNFKVYPLNDIALDEIIYELKNKNTKGINLYTNDLESGWHYFLSQIDVIPAAGGLVKNEKNEFLFIYRNNIWDLPKGQIEKGESIEKAAIREVEEECGISKLKMIKKLLVTYHIFYQKGNKLKLTHWFLMNSNFDEELTPQIEEGITKVAFIEEPKVDEIIKKSYANIKLVYDCFKDS